LPNKLLSLLKQQKHYVTLPETKEVTNSRGFRYWFNSLPTAAHMAFEKKSYKHTVLFRYSSASEKNK
jgi:hypothetical protein